MITGKTAKIVSKMGVGTVLECQSRFKSARVPKDVSKDVSRREGGIDLDQISGAVSYIIRKMSDKDYK